MVVPCLTNVKLVVFNVDAFIASEKVAVGATLVGTPVAPEAGVVLVTLGGVVSAAATVVKLQTLSAASALPATSFTPLAPLLMVAVYVMLACRTALGVSVAVRLEAL